MDKFVIKEKFQNQKKSPALAFFDLKTGLTSEVTRKNPQEDEQVAEASKKRKETPLTIASTKARKLQDQRDTIRKTQERNGMTISSDGTMKTVERPWKKYETRKIGCCNTKDCKNTLHAHEKDRTLIGQAERHGLPLKKNADVSPLAMLKINRTEGPSSVIEPAHDHHPFLSATNVALPLHMECTEIVTAEEEKSVYEKIGIAPLRAAASDLFHIMLRLTREEINTFHVCSATRMHIEVEYKKNCESADSIASVPVKARREMQEVRDKRLAQAESDRLAIVNVLRESFDKKIGDIVDRCVAASLLRPSAQQVATKELFCYHGEFRTGRSEVELLDKIVKLLVREETK